MRNWQIRMATLQCKATLPYRERAWYRGKASMQCREERSSDGGRGWLWDVGQLCHKGREHDIEGRRVCNVGRERSSDGGRGQVWDVGQPWLCNVGRGPPWLCNPRRGPSWLRMQGEGHQAMLQDGTRHAEGKEEGDPTMGEDLSVNIYELY